MKEYNSVSEPFLADVRAVVGDANVFTEPEKLEQYKTDEEYDPRRFRVPEAVVRPANAEEIAAVVKLCNKYNVPLTVRSGGTSLADGAIAVCGGIVLLMERLNKIIEMNTEVLSPKQACVQLIFRRWPTKQAIFTPVTPAAPKAA